MKEAPPKKPTWLSLQEARLIWPERFSDEALDRFHLRAEIETNQMIESIKATVKAHQTPKHLRKLV